MNIESLKYFLSVEKYNSFSLAAEELCISQSSLSKHIKKLESELNCVLFERCTRHVKLTDAGISLKKYAINIVSNYDELILDLNKFTSSFPKLSIGYIPVINQYNIAKLIVSFKNTVTDLQLTFHEGEHADILNLLFSQKIDFAFLRSDTLDYSNLYITPLAQDELVLIVPKSHPLSNVLIVPKSHPLSKRKYVSISELSNESFISLGKNSGVYDFFVSECMKASFEPNVVCFNSRIENIIGLVSAGKGISPLMRKSVECFDKKNISIVLLKEKIYSTLSLVHLKDKNSSKVEKDFKKFLINNIQKKNIIK